MPEITDRKKDSRLATAQGMDFLDGRHHENSNPEDCLSSPNPCPSASEDKRRFWEHHLAQCRQSRLTQKAYCQKHGLQLPRFYYWKRRLASDRGAVSFVPLPLPLPAAIPVPAPSCAIRILIPNGIAIELTGPVDLSQLLSMAVKL